MSELGSHSQPPRLGTGDHIALIGFVGGLAGMLAGIALEHAYPDLDIWTWRAIFWPSTAVVLAAIGFLVWDLSVKPRLARHNIRPKLSAIVAASGLIAGFCLLLGFAVVNSGETSPPIVTPPVIAVPPNPIIAPPGQRPLLSNLAKFIFACYMAKQTPAQAAKQKAWLEKNIKAIGDEIGFALSMADIPGGFRITVEAKTDEAKDQFLKLGVLPIVVTVFVDVQELNPQTIVVAYADLPKEYHNFSLLTPNAEAPPIIEAQKQIASFLALTDDACHII